MVDPGVTWSADRTLPVALPGTRDGTMGQRVHQLRTRAGAGQETGADGVWRRHPPEGAAVVQVGRKCADRVSGDGRRSPLPAALRRYALWVWSVVGVTWLVRINTKNVDITKLG